MEIETTYSVQYQRDNEPTWWCFTGRVYENPVGRMHDETYDMAAAQSVAERLFNGEIHTDSRPKYQYNITATQVTQRIYMGGTLITFGTPQEPDDTKEA